MKRIEHLLPSASIGTQRTLVSIHFGKPDCGRKVYIQAGLHADEAPGYLVATRLVELLTVAEQEGRICGEIIVVPVANPIGLDQWTIDSVQGRFDRVDNVNFNRNHLEVAEQAAEKLQGRLGNDPDANTHLIRQVVGEVLSEMRPLGETAFLKHLLFSMSHDADIVLDLHCDFQAVMHVYTGTALWPEAHDLSAQMGAYATLLAAESGGCPFDEANSQIWWLLAEKFPDHPILPACLAATVELRGNSDTLPAQTQQDTANLYTFLQRRGYLAGEAGPVPELLHDATPLEGVDYIKAEAAGILSYLKEPGEIVDEGEVIAKLTDPMAKPGQVAITEISCKTKGVLFARSCDRFARPGKIVAKVAGTKPLAGKGKQLLTI
ncbi:succinylglutamate desuccinylase/aspartoacylase family protein [Desulfopila aestuarii]|uniref:Succinylglutamate desuccinylase/Aspartoacylase catalytic domain-containing protein n=1 Tax=Desulfopila aestuarii DSM 18488 TaxID=1121416 RepID=A0A1M7YCJ0_9BACT|nr:succinylglutamate desuccinylase/aspartoacylase family protein [Desulfopila aestuarii]SHO50323.1 hypothetical protein SAMN02745220_03355 [Desulfopila aestuarii DSM 18488]